MLAASLRYYDTIDMKMHNVAVRVTKLTGSAVSLPHGTVMDRLIKYKRLSILTALRFTALRCFCKFISLPTRFYRLRTGS